MAVRLATLLFLFCYLLSFPIYGDTSVGYAEAHDSEFSLRSIYPDTLSQDIDVRSNALLMIYGETNYKDYKISVGLNPSKPWCRSETDGFYTASVKIPSGITCFVYSRHKQCQGYNRRIKGSIPDLLEAGLPIFWRSEFCFNDPVQDSCDPPNSTVNTEDSNAESEEAGLEARAAMPKGGGKGFSFGSSSKTKPKAGSCHNCSDSSAPALLTSNRELISVVLGVGIVGAVVL